MRFRADCRRDGGWRIGRGHARLQRARFLSTSSIATLPSYDDVARAHERIRGAAHRTPILRSSSFDARCGASVLFKCENLQRMGAFKFRGAYNALAQLPADARRRGVVAFSSGNHAQAVALAGRLLGVPATIVMPHDAPAVKIEATRGYGAELVLYDPACESREEIATRLAAERGLALIPPFDHPHIIAGQGTAAKELFEEAGALDCLLVPCGGGGLLSGSALAARALAPACRVFGVEPEGADDAARSFRSGRLERIEQPRTIADGARTQSLGSLTFPLVLAHAAGIVTVADDALLAAMFFLWERLKTVVEPTGALGAAALLDARLDVRGQRVGVILSGGNVDLAWALEARRAMIGAPTG